MFCIVFCLFTSVLRGSPLFPRSLKAFRSASAARHNKPLGAAQHLISYVLLGGQLFSPPLFTPSLSFKKCCNLDNQTNGAYISIILFSLITYYISIHYKEKKNKEYSKKAVARMVVRLVATFFTVARILATFFTYFIG